MKKLLKGTHEQWNKRRGKLLYTVYILALFGTSVAFAGGGGGSGGGDFFQKAITALQTIVQAIGGGLGAWGLVNLLEGYGNDNPGAKSQGIKQLMAGGGLFFLGNQVIPTLSGILK